MPRYQYAGAASTPPALTVSTISGNLTAGKAGTYSFWLQTQNRAGFSLVSTRSDITVAAGQAIRVVIPSTIRPSPATGIDIQNCVILCSADTNPLNAVIVASQPGVASNPYTIDLSEDEHLNLSSLSVANSAALPTGSDRLNGMRRSIDNLEGQIYEWSATQTAWVLSIPQAFTGYVTNLEGGLGANQSLSALDDLTEIIYPTYDLSGFSVPVKYWLVNNESAAIAQGKRIGLTVSADIAGVDTDLTNLPGVIGGIELTFLGYATTSTGALDTTGAGGIGTMTGVGEAINYTGQGDTGLQLQKDLPVGSAYVLSLRLSLDTATLSTLIPDGAVLKILPFFFNENAKPNPAAKLTGNVILGEYDRRRIVPTANLNGLALNGSGFIDVGNGFEFANVGQQTVTGLDSNTADQNVSINVSGECIVVPTVPDYAALRAIVGTVNGQGKATDWSAAVTLSNALYVSVEVTYPTAIRLDYDDVIAGSTAGTFNADTVRVYVRPTGGGNAIYWDFPVTPGNTSDTFIVGATAGTDSGGTEPPARPNDRFGLYEPADDSFTPTATAGSSVFTSQDYEVAIAFRFDTTITSIDHRTTSGCITEVDGNLADLFQIVNYLGAPVDTVWDLRSISSTNRATNKEVFCAAEGNPYRWQATETTTQDADLTFSTTTTAGAASGTLRLNNATLSSATAIYISETDANSTAIASLLDNLAENQTFRIQSVGTEATYAEYLISAVADSGSYRAVTVTHVASSGTFADASAIVVSWARDYVRPFDIDYPSAGRWVKDDSDQILVLDANPTAAIGEVGDLAIITNNAIAAYGDVLKKTSESGWTTLFNFLPYSQTTANFTQPSASGNVTVSVRSSDLFPAGASVFVATGGLYTVASVPSATSIQLTNTGATGNASPAATINSGSKVYLAGPQGPTGATGATGAAGADGVSAIATTTADFTQPAEAANVSVSVDSTAGFVAGQLLFTDADGGNTYEIAAITNATTLSLTNLAGYGNASAGTAIGDGSGNAKLVPTGPKGDTGADGATGGIPLTWDAGTTTGAASGEIRANNAAIASVTQLFISETDRDGAAITGLLGNFTVGTTLQVRTANSGANKAYFEVSGALTDNGSDRTVPVTYLDAIGTFSDGDTIALIVGYKGDVGATGSLSTATSATFTEQGSDPATPSAGDRVLYAKSDGFYQIDDTGAVSQIGSGVGGGRELLTSALTLHFSSSGNDSNDGLSAGAPKTLQGCIDFYAANYDHGGQAVTLLSAATNTYTLSNALVVKRAIGNGRLTIDFNESTVQANSTNTFDSGLIECDNVQNVYIKGCRTLNIYAGGGARAWNVHAFVSNNSIVTFENHNWANLDSSASTFSYHILYQTNCYVRFEGTYTISAGDVRASGSTVSRHIGGRLDGLAEVNGGTTATISGTPRFLEFCQLSSGSKWQGFQITWSGAVATGCKRFALTGGAIINAFGLSIDSGTYAFPGSIAGTADSGTSAHVI